MTHKILAIGVTILLISMAPATKARSEDAGRIVEIKKAFIDAAHALSDTVETAYHYFHVRFLDNDAQAQEKSAESRVAATGLIGQTILNTNGDRVATVRDIVVDKNRRAILVIVSDNGGFLGIGDKIAAFDYGQIIKRTDGGDIILPLSANDISKVSNFSYKKTASDDQKNITVIPEDGYAVSEILGADVRNPKGRKLAKIDNVSFGNGIATELIVIFDMKIVGGGERMALDFESTKMNREGTNIDFVLSERQFAEFESYRQALRGD